MSGNGGAFRVELYLYDLSQGLAKSMSMGLLGKQIDGVWHTGVIVHGYEYYFGGGIQASRPGQTMAGNPTQIIHLGFTDVGQEALHEYLQGISPRFTQETYSLIHHNCNNFSDEVSRFLTGAPIPSFITGLPEEALNTPMGQMFKPMIESMEMKMREQGGGMSSMGVPWQEQGGARLMLPQLNSQQVQDALKTDASSYFEQNPATIKQRVLEIEQERQKQSKGGSNTTNLTASSSRATQASTANKTPTSSANSTASDANSMAAALAAIMTAASSQAASSVQSATLTEEHKSSSISVQASHLQPVVIRDKKSKSYFMLIKLANKKLHKSSSDQALDEEELSVLESVAGALSQGDGASLPSLSSLNIFDKMVARWPPASMFAVLGLLNILLIHQSVPSASSSTQDTFPLPFSRANCIYLESVSSQYSTSLIANLLSVVLKLKDEVSKKPVILKAVVVSLLHMAIHPSLTAKLCTDPLVIEVASMCLQSTDAGVRCMGSALVYNLSRFRPHNEIWVEAGFDWTASIAHNLVDESNLEASMYQMLALNSLLNNSNDCCMVVAAMGLSDSLEALLKRFKDVPEARSSDISYARAKVLAVQLRTVISAVSAE